MAATQTEQAVYLYGNQLNIPCPVSLAPLNAGDVVDLGLTVGVALEPINVNNDPGGSLCIQGVFSFLKGTGYTVALMDTVLWDKTAKVAYVTGGGYTDDACIGKCTKAAASGDLTVEVLVHPYSHTVSG